MKHCRLRSVKNFPMAGPYLQSPGSTKQSPPRCSVLLMVATLGCISLPRSFGRSQCLRLSTCPFSTALQGHLKLPCSFFRNCPFRSLARWQLISLSIGCHLIGNINLRRVSTAAGLLLFRTGAEESTSVGIPSFDYYQYNVVAFFFLLAFLCISSNHFAREISRKSRFQ